MPIRSEECEDAQCNGGDRKNKASTKSDSRPEEKLNVPLVHTPACAVKRSLELARVTPEDVVMDLGCGHGNICFEAVSLGASAVGVNINGDELAFCEQKFKKVHPGQEAKVKWIQADFFDLSIDHEMFSNVTVIFMYLLPDTINYYIRPLIEGLIVRGVRVVSFFYSIDWANEYLSDIHLFGALRLYESKQEHLAFQEPETKVKPKSRTTQKVSK